NIDWGETLCATGDCWFSGWQTAFAFRGYSNTKTTVESNITIPGTVPAPGVALAVTTLDSYQPNIYSVGLMYSKAKQYQVGFTLEMQQWSDLQGEFSHDTIKNQAVSGTVGQLAFQDIWVPRIGGSYWLADNMKVTAGLAYSESPLES